MFPRRFFAGRMFAPRYFPQSQGLVGELREWRRRQHFHRSGGA